LKTHTMADSRDMIVIHNMFRREFKAIPALVNEVPGGDGAQVAIVAGHVAWMVTFLHAHHEGEDLLVWPKLLERVPHETDPLIYTMETQHAGLAQALDDLEGTHPLDRRPPRQAPPSRTAGSRSRRKRRSAPDRPGTAHAGRGAAPRART
jgi:iron-sulfur cluster repair protein YtfE (RIC family)